MRRRRVVVPLAGAVLAGILTGCGSGTEVAPPAGVDTLSVPTPDPDPDDFVGAVDNPWLPLVPGATATYAPATGSLDPAVTQLETAVVEGPEVDGVATTAVRRTTTPADGSVVETLDYYAQDVDGNVWWFGREGEWLAGEDGAEAGVAMLAVPRVGDGYREALGPGVDVRSRVRALDERVTTPAGTFGGVVLIETSTPDDGLVRQLAYAEGLGLLEVTTLEGTPETQLGLVGVDEPQG